MRAELRKEDLLIKHNNEVFEIETLKINKENQNQDYIELEINSIRMTLSKEDFGIIIADFFN
jgi:hypothetical protein